MRKSSSWTTFDPFLITLIISIYFEIILMKYCPLCVLHLQEGFYPAALVFNHGERFSLQNIKLIEIQLVAQLRE